MSSSIFNIPPVSSDLGISSYTSNGSTTIYAIGFSYHDSATSVTGYPTSYIKCYDDDGSNLTEVSYTLSSTTHIELDAPIASGHTLHIVRKFNILDKEVDWTNGSKINQTNLNRMHEQLIYNDQDLWRKLSDLSAQVASLGSEFGTVTDYTFTATADQKTYTLTGQAGITENLITVCVNNVLLQPGQYSVSDDGADLVVTLVTGASSGHIVFIKVWLANLVAYTVDNGSITTAKLADGSVTLAKINFDASGTNNQSLMKRSGVWGPSTILYTDISGADAGVRANRLDQMAAPTNSLSVNSQRITNMADGGAGTQDAATVAQMETYVAAQLPDVSGLANTFGSVSWSSTDYTEVDLGFDFDTLLMFVTHSNATSTYGFSNGEATTAATFIKMRTSNDGPGPDTYRSHIGTSFGSGWYEFTFETIANGFKVKRAGSVAGTFTMTYFATKQFTP